MTATSRAGLGPGLEILGEDDLRGFAGARRSRTPAPPPVRAGGPPARARRRAAGRGRCLRPPRRRRHVGPLAAGVVSASGLRRPSRCRTDPAPRRGRRRCAVHRAWVTGPTSRTVCSSGPSLGRRAAHRDGGLADAERGEHVELPGPEGHRSTRRRGRATASSRRRSRGGVRRPGAGPASWSRAAARRAAPAVRLHADRSASTAGPVQVEQPHAGHLQALEEHRGHPLHERVARARGRPPPCPAGTPRRRRRPHRVDGPGVEVPAVGGDQPAPSDGGPGPTVSITIGPRPGECTSMATRPRRTRYSVSAGSPSARSRAPGANATLWAQPATLGHGVAGQTRPGADGPRRARRAIVVTRPPRRRRAGAHRSVAAPDGRRLLGEVDPDGAPGDAPPAADAARGVELVPPGRELVGQPLAVARGRGGPHRPAVQVRVVEVEARGPGALAADLAGQSRRVAHVAAEAGRADERAVPAGQAPLGHLVPAGVFEVAGQAAPPGRRSAAPGSWRARRPSSIGLPGVEVRVRGLGGGDARQDLGAAVGADPDDEPVPVAVVELGSAPGRTRPRRRARSPWRCRSRWRRGRRTRRPRRRPRPGAPRSGGRGRHLLASTRSSTSRAASSQGRAPMMAMGARGCLGLGEGRSSPSTRGPPELLGGREDSAFHEPGPTAHPNSASSSPCSRR